MILIKQERPGAGAQNHLPGHSDLPDTDRTQAPTEDGIGYHEFK
jgi:hypothetical protein